MMHDTDIIGVKEIPDAESDEARSAGHQSAGGMIRPVAQPIRLRFHPLARGFRD